MNAVQWLKSKGITASLGQSGTLHLAGLSGLDTDKKRGLVEWVKANKEKVVGSLSDNGLSTSPPADGLPGYPYKRLAAAPDETSDGWPVCHWLIYPERLKHLNIDRRGMGIPAEGLPEALRHFSLNGFVVRRGYSGKLELERGPNGTDNEGLCKMNLINDRDAILDALQEVGEL